MSKPIVALIGRPNVGKSTFFNYLIGERKSIVEDTPGVTRDRIYADTEWRGRKFTIIDTGGIEPKSNNEILVQMKQQAQIAMETSDVIVSLTDIKQGVTANDYEVATMLRKIGKPIIVVCNKADKQKCSCPAVELTLDAEHQRYNGGENHHRIVDKSNARRG